jgi:hypothetical protein
MLAFFLPVPGESDHQAGAGRSAMQFLPGCFFGQHDFMSADLDGRLGAFG